MTAPYTFRLDPRVTALIVVDMQHDFCHPDGFFARAGLDISACQAAAGAVKRLVDTARALQMPVVFTRTVHEAGSVEPVRHKILPVRDRNARRDAVCLGGTWGAQILAELAPRPGEHIVDKRRYSAFYETDLAAVLQAAQVDTVIITGVTTNVCVDSTVRDAYFRGLDVVVAGDAVGAFEPHLHAATLENVELLFGAVLPAAEVVRLLTEGVRG